MHSTLSDSRKRLFKLTLSDNLVTQARSHTAKLSAPKKSLSPQYKGDQLQTKRSRQQAADACAKDWNAAHEAVGSFADEHSTL